VTTTKPEFEVSETEYAEAGPTYPIHLYVIAVGDKAVIHHRSNGQSFPMTYKTTSGARRMIARVRTMLPEATVRHR